MARDFRIPGETLVKVKCAGPAFVALAQEENNPGLHLFELGLAEKGIMITPRWNHYDMIVDDFGPYVPADVMWMLADCMVEMHLIHYDNSVLEACYAESMGGSGLGSDGNPHAGILASTGTVMGGWNNPDTANNHFMSLTLVCPALGFPWRFPTSYLTTMPLKIPVGTKASVVELHWRAIPYAVPTQVGYIAGQGFINELISKNKVLWDHTEDVPV